jgi:NAD-dependent deacetylase
MLCIGSSLEVYPVAELPLRTLANGGQIAIITKGPTPLDHRAAVRLDGDVVADLEALAEALGLRHSPPLEPEKRPRSATV